MGQAWLIHMTRSEHDIIWSVVHECVHSFVLYYCSISWLFPDKISCIFKKVFSAILPTCTNFSNIFNLVGKSELFSLVYNLKSKRGAVLGRGEGKINRNLMHSIYFLMWFPFAFKRKKMYLWGNQFKASPNFHYDRSKSMDWHKSAW